MLSSKSFPKFLSYRPCKSEVIGFIGLGRMGTPMAQNLLRAGLDVIVLDKDKAKMESFKKYEPYSLGKLAKSCRRLITMLPNNEAVEKVYLQEDDGLVAQASPDSILIDCSTVAPSLAQKISKECQARGINFLDAPVSGGVKGAEQGSLAFLIGGKGPVIESQKDLFEAMGKAIFPCGDAGSGQAAKLCNNLILGVSMVALSEGLNLGIKLGLDPQVLSAIINASSGRSWASECYNPIPGVMANTPANNNYNGGFSAPLMLKDMILAQGEARRCGAPLPTGDAAQKAYSQLILHMSEYSEKDFSSVYQYIKSL